MVMCFDVLFCHVRRLDEHKAHTFHCDTLLQSAWSALLGYVVAVRTDRIRREHRLTAGAVSHYRLVLCC
jgi:hypothetical protein